MNESYIHQFNQLLGGKVASGELYFTLVTENIRILMVYSVTADKGLNCTVCPSYQWQYYILLEQDQRKANMPSLHW